MVKRKERECYRKVKSELEVSEKMQVVEEGEERR